MSTVFISYRRVDSEHFSSHLHEALENKLGSKEVFLDVENLHGAEDWKDRLKKEIESATIIIVVIGKDWFKEIKKRDESEDQVVWEIQTAMALGKSITPVLISGATMPEAMALPESICLLPKYNALALSSPRNEDFQSLLQKILAVLAHTQPIRNTEPAKGIRRFLDQDLNLFDRYQHQDHIIQVVGESDEIFRIPAVAILNALDIPDETKVTVECKSDFFVASAGSKAALEEYKKDAIGRGKSFYDDETARLTDVIGGTNITLLFQPTSYFEYVKTNMAMDFDDGINDSLRDEFHSNKQLESLADSKFANHMGINGLVFSNDGQMIFQRRSSKVLTNPNQLCPGFSGAIKLADIKDRRNCIETLAEMDIYRELVEELGIKERFISLRRFMGISRELQRGGKPEIFFAVDIDMTAQQIVECLPKEKEGDLFCLSLRSAKSVLNQDEAKTLRTRFKKTIQKMEIDAGARASLPLLTNLAFWVNQHQAPLMQTTSISH